MINHSFERSVVGSVKSRYSTVSIFRPVRNRLLTTSTVFEGTGGRVSGHLSSRLELFGLLQVRVGARPSLQTFFDLVLHSQIRPFPGDRLDSNAFGLFLVRHNGTQESRAGSRRA